MAVTVTENVIFITAGAAQLVQTADVRAGGSSRLRVRAIRWVDRVVGVAGENAQILDDSAGNILWEAVRPGTAEFQIETQFPDGFEFRAADITGIHATVDSGILYLYLGGGRGSQ